MYILGGQSWNQTVAWHMKKVDIQNRYSVPDQKQRSGLHPLGVLLYLKIYLEVLNVIACYILYRVNRSSSVSAVKIKKCWIPFPKDIGLSI